jgi:hypothetical protein
LSELFTAKGTILGRRKNAVELVGSLFGEVGLLDGRLKEDQEEIQAKLQVKVHRLPLHDVIVLTST